MTRLNLVVAEDDPAMRHWLRIMLVRMGASVRLAASGWELLSMMAEDPAAIDLVISDVRMPIPCGIDVLAMVRSVGVTTPFVLITAFSNAELREAAQRMHASVLDKPFLAGELEARIRELLSASAVEAEVTPPA